MGFDLTMRGTPQGLPEGFPGKAEGHPEWYRMRPHAMTLMAAVLGDLGVLVEQDAPLLPTWPPPGLSEERADAIHGGGDATPDERAAYDAWKGAFDAAAGTRSRAGVPSFKFASNDGWIVQPEECLAITAALRACRIDEVFTARVNELSAAIHRAVCDALVAMGYDEPPQADLSISAQELACWLSDWAMWNEAAAKVGGYVVT